MRIKFKTENIADKDAFLAELMGLAVLGNKPMPYRRSVKKTKPVSMSKRRTELRHRIEARIQGVKTYFGYVELPKDFFKTDNEFKPKP